MAIRQFTFDSALSAQFVELEYDLYRQDPHWIPRGREKMYGRLSPSFSFYQKDGNRHSHFLALVDGKTVGRITAMVNRDLRDCDGTPVGCVGMFECVDDYAVARDLFDSATGWLGEENGLNRIWGPMDFDIWHGYRCMTRGFEYKPFVGEPYNKPYVPGFFDRYGFTLRRKWDSIEITGREMLQTITDRGAQRYKDLVARGYQFEHFDLRHFDGELRKLHELLVKSFQGFLGYTPISYPEFEEMIAPSRYAFDPRFFIFAYDESNRLAGFAAAFLEISDAVRAIGERTDVLARLQFLHRRSRVDRILFFFGGVTPEELARRTGLGRAGFHYVMEKILKAGYENVIVALRAQENKSRAFVAGSNGSRLREYALYELNRA